MMGALESTRPPLSLRGPAAVSGRSAREYLYAPRRIHFTAAQRMTLTPGSATQLFTVTSFGPNHESEREMTQHAHDLGIDPNLVSAVSLRSKMYAVEHLLEEAEAHGLPADGLRFIVSAEACTDPMMFGALARTRAARSTGARRSAPA